MPSQKKEEARNDVAFEIAKIIAWHHSDRKQYAGRGDDWRRKRNDYYAENEYETFMAAAKGVLALLEDWAKADAEEYFRESVTGILEPIAPLTRG